MNFFCSYSVYKMATTNETQDVSSVELTEEQKRENYDTDLFDRLHILFCDIDNTTTAISIQIEDGSEVVSVSDNWGRSHAMSDFAKFTDLVKKHYDKSRTTGEVFRDLAMINTALEEYGLSDPLGERTCEDMKLWIHLDKLDIALKRLRRVGKILLPNRSDEIDQFP